MPFVHFQIELSSKAIEAASEAPDLQQKANGLAGKDDNVEFILFHSRERCEMFAVAEEPERMRAHLATLLKRELRVGSVDIRHLHQAEGPDAVREYFFRSIGMEATGQITHAVQGFRQQFDIARELGHVGSVLKRLFQRSLWLSEKVRIELNLQLHALSNEMVVSDLAQKIFGDLREHSALFLSNSSSCEAYARRLSECQIREMVFSGSNGGSKSICERFNGRSVEPEELQSVLPSVDLILLFEFAAVELLMELKLAKLMQRRRNAPLLVLSLFERNGLPALKDPFNKLYNVFSYSREDLEAIVSTNIKEHRKVAALVNQLVEKEVDDFFAWYDSGEQDRVGNIVGKSDAMQRILELVARIAQTDISVLIDGESGTGKELIARSVHEHSNRADNPFIAVNCGAIPESLLESELFGHVKGSFTGATSDKKGLLAEAEKGTIFLDEIGETTQTTQVKLLRFLQEGEIKPVGSNETLKLDVRVIAATNRDLARMVDEGHFRQDLYYRLNVIQVTIPPLRDRKDDVLPLAQYFVKKYAEQLHRSVYGVQSEAQELLRRYDWPGNVRELENAIERAVALSADDMILKSDLPPNVDSRNRQSGKHYFAGNLTLKELEKRHISAMLKAHDWNYDLVTEILGIGRTTLWRKMKEYGISN